MRKKLIKVGIDDFEYEKEVDAALKSKIERLRNRGHSYQVIADKFVNHHNYTYCNQSISPYII